MSKKLIALFTSTTLVFLAVFAACGSKNSYKDPADNKGYKLVTNEVGEMVRASDGELLVYSTDANGKVVTNSSGQAVTQKQAFIGQIESSGVVIDYAYKVKLPDGWLKSSETGEYKKKNSNATVEVDVVENTFSDYCNICRTYIKQVQAAIKKDKVKNSTISMKEYTYSKADSKVYIVRYDDGSNSDTAKKCDLIFETHGNVFNITYQSAREYYSEDDFMKFCNAITYLDYVYYPDVTSVSNTAASTAKAATTKAATTK